MTDSERTAEKLKNYSDHDLLIGHHVKIDSLSMFVHDLGRKMENQATSINIKWDDRQQHCEEKLTKKVDEKVDMTTFKWLMGIIIAIVIAQFAVVGANYISMISLEQTFKAHIQIANTKESFEKEYKQ